MTERVAPLLVLGLGNRLLSDDGFGLELLERLAARHRAPGGARVCGVPVEFVDGGTLGTALLGALEGRAALLILDAVGDPRPGRVQRLDDPLARPAAQGVGGHGANASGLLGAALLTGDLPPRAVVVGAAPERLTTRIGLSPALRAALPEALALADATLEELAAELAEALPCTS